MIILSRVSKMYLTSYRPKLHFIINTRCNFQIIVSIPISNELKSVYFVIRFRRPRDATEKREERGMFEIFYFPVIDIFFL